MWQGGPRHFHLSRGDRKIWDRKIRYENTLGQGDPIKGQALCQTLSASLIKESAFAGWSGLAIFGLGIAVSLLMFIPNIIYLSLDDEGLEVGSPVWEHRVAWKDVQSFEVVRILGIEMIAIRYRNEYKNQNFMVKANTATAGVEGAILNLYAASLDEILGSLRERHAGQRRQGFRRA